MRERERACATLFFLSSPLGPSLYSHKIIIISVTHTHTYIHIFKCINAVSYFLYVKLNRKKRWSRVSTFPFFPPRAYPLVTWSLLPKRQFLPLLLLLLFIIHYYFLDQQRKKLKELGNERKGKETSRKNMKNREMLFKGTQDRLRWKIAACWFQGGR